MTEYLQYIVIGVSLVSATIAFILSVLSFWDLHKTYRNLKKFREDSEQKNK